MNSTGASEHDLVVRARSVLIDALVALEAHRDAVIVIGAQAVYLHTGSAPVAVAEATKDSDLGIDLRTLGDDPLIEEAMTHAGFYHDPVAGQPGSWLSPDGIPVDLMVPEAMAGKGSRSVEAPPHDKRALRRAVGLEAAVIDNAPMLIHAITVDDPRSVEARVAGPAALVVAKLHKLGERLETPHRLLDKDAYDVYRLLVTVPTGELAESLERLLADDLAGEVTRVALEFLGKMFAQPDSVGSVMAGRAEELVGDPAVVAAACAALTDDLLVALGCTG
ncbi:hypothetical protein [Microbacterium kunmingense]|uniref:hypothetical protein n=1 Tax=Microbacterium kunmingense TaxID=2915939 RepID=UPI002005A199|nr:hypothetical protein [Microbacterium kunmingense]